MSLIPVLGKLSQNDYCEMKGSLGITQRDSVSKNIKQRKKKKTLCAIILNCHTEYAH